MGTDSAVPGLWLAELLGVLSFGADLGMGQPMEHVLRQSLVALKLAEQIGLSEPETEAVYFGSLMVWVGCHVDAYEQAKWFGDETVLKADFRRSDFATASAGPMFMMRHLGAGLPTRQRLAMLPGFIGEGRQAAESMLENHWRATDQLMERLELDMLVRGTVEQSFERWDGRGIPNGAKGSQILMPARVVNLADVVTVYHRAGGLDAAVGVARERAGTQFDPELVAHFTEQARRIFDELDAVDPWQGVLAAGPASRYRLSGSELDRILEVLADFIDVKSPFTLGHSRGVADLVELASPLFGLTPDEGALVRQAALVHDIGRLGVPNLIWDKPGPLTPTELERARMHAYLTERMLASSDALARLAAIAAQHHERLDGSGYPHGLTGAEITPAGRLLAAADAYHARLEERPHRPAMSREQAAGELQAEVRGGRIDADAAAAVLSAAGHRVSKRRERPAGLTAREAEILVLLARGLTNKQIAAELTISASTASSHVEHIYAKIGVRTRALASLYAVRHGLMPSRQG